MSEIKPWRGNIGKHDAYMIMCDVLDVLCEKEAIKKAVFERLKQAPSTDRKGHWVKRIHVIKTKNTEETMPIWNCSECGRAYDPFTADRFINFCPECGADMRGGGSE